MTTLCACGCGEPAPIAKRNDARLGVVKGQPRRFISGHNARVIPRESPTDYVANRMTLDDSGCWLWTGLLTEAGYGKATRRHGPEKAHRYAYVALVGEIPDGLELDHLCCVPRCVNPDHLEPVTREENQRRAAERRTHCRRGHEFSEPYTNGPRRCGKCHADAARKRYWAARA